MNRKRRTTYLALCAFAFAALGCGCAGKAGLQNSRGQTETAVQTAAATEADGAQSQAMLDKKSIEVFAMDTEMRLTAYGENAEQGLKLAKEEIQRLDALWSISKKTSDVYRINHGSKEPVDAETAALLTDAIKFAELTGGLFDPSIQPVMELWGFPSKHYQVPDEKTLAETLALVDYRNIHIVDGVVELGEGMKLDFGGIAKGYTSTRVMDLMREAGVSSAIVSLGGNVQELGSRPDGSAWRVGIQDPNDTSKNIAVLNVTDGVVITSGAYQRFFKKNGKRYHHIIDPRTGYPAESGLVSVSIISPNGTLADALSTSLFIMGLEQASDFWRANRADFDAILMTEDGTVYVTEGIEEQCTVTTGGKVEIIR